ncbi:hypothetical protein Scep_023135 [Stephania cephalantha]|uniref:Uncharacterized protein n=1 Tax=Stephania cephalantha TaxID=152367 RepID=A0AAP0HXA5_9MAGN
MKKRGLCFPFGSLGTNRVAPCFVGNDGEVATLERTLARASTMLNSCSFAVVAEAIVDVVAAPETRSWRRRNRGISGRDSISTIVAAYQIGFYVSFLDFMQSKTEREL